MDQLDAMRVFVRVAEMTGFTRAADSLGLPKASVSGAVQQLETTLGTRLLHRTTRRVQLTQDGQSYYERCKDLLTDMDELQAMFAQGEQQLRGRLRVDMSSGMARNLVIPRLPEFLQQHPRLEIELSSTDRRVDLVREGFDCVLRVGTLADGNLVARPLGAFTIVNCASPDYLRRHGTPRTLQDLADHQLIHYVSTLGNKSPGWEYPEGDGYASLPMAGNAEAYQAACLAGLGLIQAPLAGLERLLESGQLVEVLPDLPAEPMPVAILYANRRHLPKRVHAFMAWVDAVLQPFLEPLHGAYSAPAPPHRP
jgi:DNA-binding transcriptional LysR family regulator